MENINPSSNVNRRGRTYIVGGLLLFLGGLSSVVLGILFLQLPLLGSTLSGPASLCFGISGVPMTIAGGAMIFRGTTLQKDNMVAYDIGEALKTFLGSDSRYTYIRNVSRRNLGYIDAVLVGPPGALVFRTVEYAGEWVNERAEWRVRGKNGNLKAAPRNPTRECARDVYALRKFLAKRNLNKVPVYGIVVFGNDRVSLKGQGPVIPIAEKHTLYQIISRDYLAEERIKHPQVRATVDAIIN